MTEDQNAKTTEDTTKVEVTETEHRVVEQPDHAAQVYGPGDDADKAREAAAPAEAGEPAKGEGNDGTTSVPGPRGAPADKDA